MPRSSCTRFRSFMISAWVVTSSAVEGSSAMSSSGSRASAAASATRWHMPPESWNGMRCGTSSPVMPTSARRRLQLRRRARRGSKTPAGRKASPRYATPQRISGFIIVNGSCRSIEIRRPRTLVHFALGKRHQVEAVEADRARARRRSAAGAARSPSPSAIFPSPIRRRSRSPRRARGRGRWQPVMVCAQRRPAAIDRPRTERSGARAACAVGAALTGSAARTASRRSGSC